MKKNDLIINIIKLAVVFTLFLFNSLIGSILLRIFNINRSSLSANGLIILRLAVYLILITIFTLMYKKDIKKEWKNFTSKLGKNSDTMFKYYFIGLFLMMFFNIILNFILKLGQSQNENAVQDMIKTSPIIMLIFAGLLAPIIEEIVFRKSFKNVFKNKWAFVLLSGFVFGLLHIIGFELKNPLEVLYIIPYGSLGAGFALMDYEIDSTFPSIAMHMAHNTVLISLSIILRLFV